MISWFLEEATGMQRTVGPLAERLLFVNFASIHTTSVACTHALFHLAARPEYIKALREEAELIIASDGWTKDSMQKMPLLDSFLREVQRYEGFNLGASGELHPYAPYRLYFDADLRSHFSSTHDSKSGCGLHSIRRNILAKGHLCPMQCPWNSSR